MAQRTIWHQNSDCRLRRRICSYYVLMRVIVKPPEHAGYLSHEGDGIGDRSDADDQGITSSVPTCRPRFDRQVFLLGHTVVEPKPSRRLLVRLRPFFPQQCLTNRRAVPSTRRHQSQRSLPGTLVCHGIEKGCVRAGWTIARHETGWPRTKTRCGGFWSRMRRPTCDL